MPHFGRRVIGDAKYEEQVKKTSKGRAHFGPRVVGKIEEPAAEPEGEPMPSGGQNPPSDSTSTETPQPKNTGVSIAEMEKLRTDNPALVDELLSAELQRVEGPRKGALRALLASEAGEKGQGREQVIDQLAGLLESKKPPVVETK